jgi:hypothetical protein
VALNTITPLTQKHLRGGKGMTIEEEVQKEPLLLGQTSYIVAVKCF